MGLPCHGCAYTEEVPGSAHLSCVFRFKDGKDVPTCQANHGHQWFHFPVNFDPVWGPEECKGFSKEKDEKNVREKPPLESLFRLFS